MASPSPLDSIVAASLAGEPASALMPRMSATAADAAAHATDGASVALLWRIRRRIGHDAMPVIQFVPCDSVGRGSCAAAGFARVAALLLGRSLLIDTNRASNSGAVPDVYVKRLYHQSLAGPPLCALLSQSIDAGGRAAGAFSAIIVDQLSLAHDDSACAMAPLCKGSVLVVTAGVTELRHIRSAAQRIAAVGGVVLGTVLIGAPSQARMN